MRQRNGFNGDKPAADGGNKYPNLIEYEEKFSIPTDGGAYGMQSPVQNDVGGGYGVPSQYGSAQQFGSPSPVSSGATAVQSGYGMPVSERPMVFALRRFTDMYVYEYKDRLEYYRRTANGMEFVNTEYKRPAV